MRISVWPSYDRSWQETLRVARFAEANGFESVWVPEHLVLPATMQTEHLDIHPSYGHHYIALNRPAIAPIRPPANGTVAKPRRTKGTRNIGAPW